MEINSSPTILLALRYICRVTCYCSHHQIRGKRNCNKGCDPVCILCCRNARYLRYAYHCNLCKFPFCPIHFQQHIKANTEFKGFNCLVGNLSEITEIKDKDLPKMIMHVQQMWKAVLEVSHI